ncbi:helix-turn-helix domain-containing protein [Actinomadura verrucosospora]|uniref:XRE family transcriptional regulator n=1 Tax=Actinomadura verrucosospora TaxID=46165 RepID=A0A7D3W5J5_ACTVE|nr:helix-turn-helix transcriptional regulator [Actinomadura verrucosospora]QKG26596.1 XRE family transcriptional regulator [Actinomadura verrucosospora]
MVDPYSPQAIWGRELRHYRTKAGLKQSELAERINFSESLISGAETGQVPASIPFAKACDREFDTGGALLRALDFKKARRFPAGFAEYLEVEKKTAMIRWYEGLCVPGVLQTPDYARALLRAGRPGDTDEEIEALVTARMDRKAFLSEPNAPTLWAVIDEPVLRRPVGSAEVMRDQLAYLLKAIEHPKVCVQLLPFDTGAHAGLTCSFILLTLPDGGTVAYAEDLTGGRFIERPEDLGHWTACYESIKSSALPVKQSAALIRDVIGDGHECEQGGLAEGIT